MLRILLAATALLSGLATSPAFAQTSQAALAADSARTLEQNQRAYVASRPAATQRPAVTQAAPAKDRPFATLPPITGRRVELADRAR